MLRLTPDPHTMPETPLPSGFHASPSAQTPPKTPPKAPAARPGPNPKRGPPKIDLRRRSALAEASWILPRAELLPAPDRALLRAVFADAIPIARLARLHHQDAPALRRRVRALLTRLASPDYACCWRYASRWPKPRRDVARLCVIEARPQREAARELDMTPYAIREHLRTIRCLALQQHPPTK